MVVGTFFEQKVLNEIYTFIVLFEFRNLLKESRALSYLHFLYKYFRKLNFLFTVKAKIKQTFWTIEKVKKKFKLFPNTKLKLEKIEGTLKKNTSSMFTTEFCLAAKLMQKSFFCCCCCCCCLL